MTTEAELVGRQPQEYGASETDAEERERAAMEGNDGNHIGRWMSYTGAQSVPLPLACLLPYLSTHKDPCERLPERSKDSRF